MANRVRVVASDGRFQYDVVRPAAAAKSSSKEPQPLAQSPVSSVVCVPLTTTPLATPTIWTHGSEPMPRGMPQERGINKEQGRLELRGITRRVQMGKRGCVMTMAVVMVALTLMLVVMADGGASGMTTMIGTTMVG